MNDTTIVEVDQGDLAGVRAWWEADCEATRHGRPFAVCQPWKHLRSAVQEPSPYHRLVLLAARTGGRVVGTALLGLSLRDNLHLVDLQISVLPGRRRKGIGSQLYDAASARLGAEGRTTIVGEANTPADGDDGAVAFARSLGFESVHTEHHLWLPLPVEPDQVAQLRGRVDHLAGGYDVLTWGNRCPQEYVAAYCAMASQMSTDAPYGRIDWEPVRLDEERLRAEETRTAGAYDRVVAVARRRSDRAFAGYSVLYLPRDERHALQDDTLVMREHRGHRLGLLLKLTTLDILRRDHPERTSLHSWTWPENHAMLRTNLAFGYTPVELMHEMQRVDAGPARG